MFRKIALGTALIVGSVSGAFAFNNIGEIETRSYVQAPAAFDAHASAQRQAKPAPQMNRTFDRAGDVSAY